MARRNRDQRPAKFSADFSATKKIPPQAVNEIIAKAADRLAKAENWEAAAEMLARLFKRAATKFGGLS